MATDKTQTLQSLGITPYFSSSSRDLRLDLNYRNIQRLPYDLFKLEDLQWLNLNVNRLNELPPEFGSLKKLRWLYLENNLFDRFPDVLCELTELIRLYLSANSLKIIPRDICRLTELRWLDLSDNSFWEFPLGLCDNALSKLERLVMDNNKLTCLPAQVSILKGLKVLHLSDNQIEWLPQTICDMEKLEEMLLTNNPLKTLPAYFGERLKRLRTLVCKGCPFIDPLKSSVEKGMKSLREYQGIINRRCENTGLVYFKKQNDGSGEKPCYRMRTRPRGVAVIIDNISKLGYSDSEEGERTCTPSWHSSSDYLRSVLLKLGFNVRMMRGLMSLDIISALRFLSLEDHSYFDCLMVCVLSYGGQGKVIGPDGISVDVKQLMDIFTRENCPTLAEKPKLFFLQILDKHPDNAPRSSASSRSPAVSPNETERNKRSPRSLMDPKGSLIPEDDDFLLTVAMVPPAAICESLRDMYTLYVNVLFGMMEKYARKLNILDVVTAVHSEVRTIQIATVDGQTTSVKPIIQSSLKYNLYLSVPTIMATPTSSLGMASP
ncbi:caspase-2-like [Lytechinus pictus]|uniref:caspase-2-like n=1 Tax=Lytechinus pictus TaxID=7653 RepID=UPI0030BA03E0